MDIDRSISPWELEEDHTDVDSPPPPPVPQQWLLGEGDGIKQIGVSKGRNGGWWVGPECCSDTACKLLTWCKVRRLLENTGRVGVVMPWPTFVLMIHTENLANIYSYTVGMHFSLETHGMKF